MPQSYSIENAKAIARLAGVLYLIIIACGVWSEGFARGPLIVDGDSAATLANIAGSLFLFRLSIAADCVMVLADIGLSVLLFVLLRNVNAVLALGAMILRLVQAVIVAVSLLGLLAVLVTIEQGAGAGAAERVGTLVLLHAYGYDLGLIFFGVNCLVTGYLIVRSEFLPVMIGAGIAASGLVYLAGSAIRILAPDVSADFEPAYLVPLIAESAFCLWLIGPGVRGGTAVPRRG